MTRTLVLLTFLTAAVLIPACDSSNPTDPVATEKGSVLLVSVPAGAQIWLSGSNTGKVTPDSLTNLTIADHTVTLKLAGYFDTTFTVRPTANQSVTRTVVLRSTEDYVSFGPVRIWETTGTTSSQPSGLDLSSGNAYGISSADKGMVDIYYSTDGTGGQGFLVQSADLSTQMTRVTKFRIGLGSNLDDGTDSPLSTSGTWINHMSDRESNYVFLYDHDGHYSKAKIVNFGGGTPGNPAWVELQWWYNTGKDDVRF